MFVHRFTQQGSVWASDAGDLEQPLPRLRVETTTGDVTLPVEDSDRFGTVIRDQDCRTPDHLLRGVMSPSRSYHVQSRHERAI